MIFWLIAAGMTALALALLLRPLLRRPPVSPPPAAFDIAVYRDQLAEVERDRARGLLGEEEAAAARLEIERRILAADDRAPPGRGPGPARGRMTVPALIAALPLGALGLYLVLGAPGLPSTPFAQPPQPDAAMTAANDDARLEAVVAQLAQRMAEDPADPQGWLLLARSYATLRRYAESAEAYRQAIVRGAGDAETRAAYGEALAAASGGQVTEAALKAFEAALAANPAEPRARFYVGLARAQAGHPEEALALWVKLEAEAPADAPWRAPLAAQIDRAAAALGLDPATLPGRIPPPPAAPATGPETEELAAAQTMSPEERETFIRGMVESLAERLRSSPDDLDGWIRLARSRQVLGEPDAARDAWLRAAALAPGRTDVQLAYAQAILDAQKPGEALPPAFAETVARIRALEPQNRIGLFLAGVAELAAGRPDGARALWEELLAQLPEGSPERAELERRLDAFRAGG